MRFLIFLLWLLHFLPLPVLGRIGNAVGWLMYLAWSPAPAFVRATRALRGRPGEAFGIVGYLVPWTAVAFALAVPQLGVAVPVAGVLLIAGQAWSKWLLVLTVADVRPVTLGTLTLQRRVS